MIMESNYYLEFENKFRGERENILKKFVTYDSLIDLILEQDPLASLLDIGCGRGEWLEKCSKKFNNCIGIESDLSMINLCKDNGLNVIEGDAIEKLSNFSDGSVTVITIFHMIEHLEYENLITLISECQRVLSDNGFLIMETPSIDNLIVSSKTFYVDPTHISPINPDGICFHLEKAGFTNAKYLYLNGGPLENASPLKITRILNGVAQDLCIISTKKQEKYDLIFSDNTNWQSSLNIGVNTFEAATDYDLKLETLINQYETYRKDYKEKIKLEKRELEDKIYLLNEEVTLSKEEIRLLKARLKYIIYIAGFFRLIIRPIVFILKLIRRLMLLLCNKIFKILVKYKLTRNFLTSKIVLSIINFILNRLLGNPININANHILNKANKIIKLDNNLTRFNQKLSLHFEGSPKAKEYKKKLSGRNK